MLQHKLKTSNQLIARARQDLKAAAVDLLLHYAREGQDQAARAPDQEYDADIEAQCNCAVEQEGETAHLGKHLGEGGPALEPGD